MSSDILCWCDSGRPAALCCQRVLHNRCEALTAEELMRARYSAYVTGNEEFLLGSWAPETRPNTVSFNPAQRWLGLKVTRKECGQVTDEVGVVEFVARFKIDGRGHRLAEVSRFRRDPLGWLYVDGELLPK